MEEVRIENLLNLDETIAKEIFQGVTYFEENKKIIWFLLTYVKKNVTFYSYKTYKNNMK